MALNLEAKKKIVANLSRIAQNSMSMVALDYRGLNVAELTELRCQARAVGVQVKIARNTLAKRAFEPTDFGVLTPVLLGPILLAFSDNDPGAAARVVRTFLKEHKGKVTVKGVVVAGQFYQPQDMARVADLPTRDQAIAMLMSVMKAPTAKVLRTLKEVNAKMVRTVAAVGEKKQQESK